MLERGRISCLQTIYLLVVLVGATAIIFLPSITSQAAGRDAWMAPVLATAPAVYLIFVIAALGKRFPGKTLMEYLPLVFGTWPGKAVGLLYIFFFLHTNGVIIREFGELMVSEVMPHTPLMVFHGFILLLCAWAVRGGLEVLARVVEMTFPLTLVLFVFAILLTAREMQLENLLPVLENGIKPVIKASQDPIGWRGEVVLLAMILPFLSKPGLGKRCGLVAVIFIGILLTVDSMANTAVFGEMVKEMTFPTFELIRMASIGSFMERIDAVLVTIWVMGMFGKIGLFYYVTVLGIAQIANVSDYRPLVLPLGVVLAALSFQVAANAHELVEYIVKGFPGFSNIFEYIIPTLLLLVSVMRGQDSKNQEIQSPEKTS